MKRVRVLHPDGIGELQLFVILLIRLQHVKPRVQAVRAHAERLLHLRFRFARRAVCRHGKRARDAQGRDQRVRFLHRVLQKHCAKVGQRRGRLVCGVCFIDRLRPRLLCVFRQVVDGSGLCRAAGSRERAGGENRRKDSFAFHRSSSFFICPSASKDDSSAHWLHETKKIFRQK